MGIYAKTVKLVLPVISCFILSKIKNSQQLSGLSAG